MFELQKSFLSKFKNSDLSNDFYFTGGTALSLYYYNHRASDDIYLFTDRKELLNVERINYFLKSSGIKVLEFGKKYDRRLFVVLIENQPIKTEFTYYPFKRLFPSEKVDGIYIDSKFDIITNKIAALCDREEEKDIFDLSYFIKEEGVESFKKILNDYFEKKFGIPGCRYIVEKILTNYEGNFESVKVLKNIDKDMIKEKMKNVLRVLIREDIDEIN